MYFKFELPYWNVACADPASKLTKTMVYIERHFEGDELELRRTQIRRGLEAGRKELVKMTTKNLLRCPLIFLLLCNRSEGPAFLRAVLYVLTTAEFPDDVTMIHDIDSDKWGSFRYGLDGLLVPEHEQRYINVLMAEKDDVVHWWRQLCLNWRCLVPDL